MHFYLRLSIALIILTVSMLSGSAQILTKDNVIMREDSVLRDFSNQPYFGIYKDNYFIFGPAINKKPTRQNTNIKFQISIAQRLTNATLPFGTYLYLFYTQKCFWNVMENSMPMTDLNFNPGIGITKPIFSNNRYIGKTTLIIEHESNGRDSIWSRSWNRVALSANIMVSNHLMAHGKIWIPIVDGVNNKDIVKYCGFWQAGIQYVSNNNRFSGGINVVKRGGWNLNANVTIDLAYRIFRKENQFLFMQLYNGYGEGLLEYNKFHCNLRVGLLIKPKIFSDF